MFNGTEAIGRPEEEASVSPGEAARLHIEAAMVQNPMQRVRTKLLFMTALWAMSLRVLAAT
jgi:hypothetical protein